MGVSRHPRIGVINIFLMQLFGLKSAPLNIATLGGIGFVQGLTLAPLAYVMISAALRGMNPALVEAASVHRVNKWRTLVRVELPLVWPALLSAIIWMFTVAIAAFDVPGVIGMANNIFTFSTAIYFMINPNEGLPRYGLSGAYGTIMVGLSLILMIPYFVALKQSHRYQIISGKSYQSRPVELRRWWMLGWGLLGTYFLLAFVLPLLAIFWVSLLPTFRFPRDKRLLPLPLSVTHAIALRQFSVTSRREYAAPHGDRAYPHCSDEFGNFVDRDPLAHALASCFRCHCLSTPPRAQPAFCSSDRLLRVARVQRSSTVWNHLCAYGGLRYLLDQFRNEDPQQ